MISPRTKLWFSHLIFYIEGFICLWVLTTSGGWGKISLNLFFYVYSPLSPSWFWDKNYFCLSLNPCPVRFPQNRKNSESTKFNPKSQLHNTMKLRDMQLKMRIPFGLIAFSYPHVGGWCQTWVKVFESREVSKKIADDLGIKREYSQLLFVKDQQAVWNISH